jgi:hypothetical protein
MRTPRSSLALSRRMRYTVLKAGLCGRRPVRCCCVQTGRSDGGGGVLSMAKGAALFDAVVISNTEAERVRLGWRRRTGCGADCGRHGCACCAQWGGVVFMGGGTVMFKGGNISNTKAVRARVCLVCTSQVACCNGVCCALPSPPTMPHATWCGNGRCCRWYIGM